MATGLRHSLAIGAGNSERNVQMPKKSPQLLAKMKNTGTASESDGSVDSSPSPSVESCKENQNQKRITRRGSEWEILEGLKDGQRFDKRPDMYSGYLHKKRKWPLKGWHKRYFILDKGILTYGKGPSEIARGKVHGQVDIGLSVISTKGKRKRIDIDADEFIHHLKAKRFETFVQWVEELTKHRLYRQHVLTFGNVRHVHGRILRDINKPTNNPTPLLLHSTDSVKNHPSPPRLAVWVMESNTQLEKISKELNDLRNDLGNLTNLLDHLESVVGDSDTAVADGCSPSAKKDKRKFGLRKKKSSNSSLSWGGQKGSSGDLTNPILANSSPHKTNSVKETDSSSPLSNCSFIVGLSTHSDKCALSTSNPSLNSISQSSRPVSFYIPASSECQPDCKNDFKIHCQFIQVARNVHNKLQSITNSVLIEQNKMRTVLQSNAASSNPQAVINNLQNSLRQSIQQNTDLRLRLNTIHVNSDIGELTEPVLNSPLSYDSSCVSTSDIFFDAEEEYRAEKEEEEDEECIENVPEARGVATDTSSEAGSISSEDGSISSENSEGAASDYTPQIVIENTNPGKNMTGHREKLPCPRPSTEGLSLWNLLRRNIGKDLSQVSMPVALNEPLNLLQRLCEELEYSELLDKAKELNDPYERMAYVAAFAVSSYCSSYYRAGSKPFNPLLGETYECIREDKGFNFIAEQVSHHPPVSACHAQSKNYLFWQDVRIKTKFWGKSMEFQPIGYVNVKLLSSENRDHYKWNKVTTCVHNLFSGQRWADLYGELKITNVDRNITCKLTFVKASYWSTKRHEVYGNVFDENGAVVRKLFGKWNEALYCGVPPSAKCIWRPGTMPEDYELYYGFTRFAMELNELEPELEKYLPKTDTRFRPDQRLLEEGDLNRAEQIKLQLEQAQRDRRKQMEDSNVQHEPKWFRKKNEENEEVWEFTNKYWELRNNHGFSSINLDQLWLRRENESLSREETHLEAESSSSGGSGGSSDTLKWHGSLSDVSVSSGFRTPGSGIAHSARVQTPQRHRSESVLYLGQQTQAAPSRMRQLYPVNYPASTTSPPTLTVAERIIELERQQHLQTKYTYYDPEKKHKVSDQSLKVIQKKALLSYYERHHSSWRSEPQLSPSSSPPQPRPRLPTPVSRRSSSASDYQDAVKEQVPSKINENKSTAKINSDVNLGQESYHGETKMKSQYSSSCNSLSSPMIIGEPISVDEWVPELPPKKAHMRSPFTPARISPELPPPSPPPLLDEEFVSDEPFPPPPPEIISDGVEKPRYVKSKSPASRMHRRFEPNKVPEVSRSGSAPRRESLQSTEFLARRSVFSNGFPERQSLRYSSQKMQHIKNSSLSDMTAKIENNAFTPTVRRNSSRFPPKLEPHPPPTTYQLSQSSHRRESREREKNQNFESVRKASVSNSNFNSTDSVEPNLIETSPSLERLRAPPSHSARKISKYNTTEDESKLSSTGGVESRLYIKNDSKHSSSHIEHESKRVRNPRTRSDPSPNDHRSGSTSSLDKCPPGSQSDVSTESGYSSLSLNASSPPVSPTRMCCREVQCDIDISEHPKDISKYKQRTEIVLRIGAATSDASSQTDSTIKDGECGLEYGVNSLTISQRIKEELECEKLSRDLISHLDPSDRLCYILGPKVDTKKSVDYISDVFQTGALLNCQRSDSIAEPNRFLSYPAMYSADDTRLQEASSSADIQQSCNKQSDSNHSGVQCLQQKKDDLLDCLSRQVNSLQQEQKVLSDEMRLNDVLGESLSAKFTSLASSHEASKLRLHVREIGHITSLLLGLAGRLAKVENALARDEADVIDDKKTLESKREKLCCQLAEAKSLKENIDRRGSAVSSLLASHLTETEFAEYEYFAHRKCKLLVESRHLTDRIQTYEMKLNALKEAKLSTDIS